MSHISKQPAQDAESTTEHDSGDKEALNDGLSEQELDKVAGGTVSTFLKTRHDTAKNSINTVR